MTGLSTALIALAGLAIGTFAIRLSGPTIATRLHLIQRSRELVDAAAVVLLCAVMASSALLSDHRFADPARPIGVAVAILLVWRRVPFLLIVAAAAAVTAALRHFGL